MCIYGFGIERLYDEQGNEAEMVVVKVGSHIFGVLVEQGRYHSLEAMELGIFRVRHIKIEIIQKYNS